MHVYIKTPRNNTISLHIDSSYSINKLKKILCDREGIPITEQRLIFSGKQLEDDKTVAFYAIQKDSTIDLLLRLRGGIQPLVISFNNFILTISSSGVLTAQATGTYTGDNVPSESTFTLMNQLNDTTTEAVPGSISKIYDNNYNGAGTFRITFTITVTDSGFSSYYKQLMRYAFYITTVALSSNTQTSTLIKYLFIPSSSNNIQMSGNKIKSFTAVDISSGNKSIILPPITTHTPIMHFKITAVNSPYIFQMIPYFTVNANYTFYDTFPSFDSTIDGSTLQLYLNTVNHTVSLASDGTNWTVLNRYSYVVPINEHQNLPQSILTESSEINAVQYTYINPQSSYNNMLVHPMTSSYLKYIFLKNSHTIEVTFNLYFPSGKGVDNSDVSNIVNYNAITITLPSTKVAGLIITYVNNRYYIISATINPDYYQATGFSDPTITLTKTVNYIENSIASRVYMPSIMNPTSSICKLVIIKGRRSNSGNNILVAQSSGVFIMENNYTAISMAFSTVLWFIVNVNNATSAYLPVNFYAGAGTDLTFITYPTLTGGGGGGGGSL